MKLSEPHVWALWRLRLLREACSLRGAFNHRLAFWTWWSRLLPNFALECVRAQMYRLGGCDIAPDAALQGSLIFLGKGPIAGRLHVGKGTIIAPGVTFGLDAYITIGRNVNIGPRAPL